jgi:hypothetical protein
VREADRLAGADDWDGLLRLRTACLDATEETGRQLWGPARYAAYRVALDGPAELAAAMVEPGVVRFGLGPLTEVVAQRHSFTELAPHLDATVLPVVAQERVLRGEDLRDDDRAKGAPDDPPLVLQPFEPAYVLPDYRPTERLDGAVTEVSDRVREGWGMLEVGGSDDHASAVGGRGDRPPPEVAALIGALEDVVAPWSGQSSGEVRVVALRGTTDDACRRVLAGLDGEVRRGPVGVDELFSILAHAGASGGVHGRRRGGAAGRSLAWWVARCATGLDRSHTLDPEELEFRLEDVERIAFRSPGEATWRLELALGVPTAPQDPVRAEWAVAVAAFDRSEGPMAQPGDSSAPDGAPW